MAAGVALALVTVTTAAELSRRPASTPATPAAAARATARPPLGFSFKGLDARTGATVAVRARSGILVDLDTRTVLWAREQDARRAPASLTKMVTAMVALDHASPDQVLTVPREAAAMPPDRMGLRAGEKVTVREALYGLFLDSGNDAATTLATRILRWGRFVADMNAKVRALGLHDTRFVNATGLDATGHFSTAYDLAVIGGYLEAHYPLLARIAATPEKVIPATATHRAFDARNLNKMLTIYPGATGLKTGFTDFAGGCLVASATRAGRHLLAVVLGSDVFFTDAVHLLDYGFSRPPGPAATRTAGATS